MQPRELDRSLIDRVLGGVCGGLGFYLGINAWWIRLVFSILIIFTAGVGIILYVLLWLVISPQTLRELPPGAPQQPRQVNAETLIIIGSGIVGMGIIILALNLGLLSGARGDIVFPFVVIGLGFVLLAQQLRRSS
ncbi:MAG: PspC domain-containing protein [Anaerolineales bacterium]